LFIESTSPTGRCKLNDNLTSWEVKIQNRSISKKLLPFVLQYNLSKKYCNTAINTKFKKYWQYGGNTQKSIANSTESIAILTTLQNICGFAQECDFLGSLTRNLMCRHYPKRRHTYTPQHRMESSQCLSSLTISRPKLSAAHNQQKNFRQRHVT